MGKSWDDISEGVRVEVLNTDSGLHMKVYWIASIIKLAGKQIGTRTGTRYTTRGTDVVLLDGVFCAAPAVR